MRSEKSFRQIQLASHCTNVTLDEIYLLKVSIAMFKKRYGHYLASITAGVFLSLSIPAYANNPQDPYEPFNRAMYQFNDGLDRFILKPVATVYNAVIPKPVAKSFSNFFSNIDTVPTLINDLLQCNFYQATSDAWRLVINSTIGILGFFDVASHIGLEPNSEDFGLTLARWGYKNSNYLVLPFFGPSTVRDTVGLPINYYAFSVYPYIYPQQDRYALYGAGVVVRRADLLRFEGVMQQAALDKYIFMRDAYLQRRNHLIERNEQLGNPYLEKNSSLAEESVSE